MNHSSQIDIGVANDKEEWTIECLVDQLFLSLAGTKECVTNGKDETLHVKKYYRRAREIIKSISIWRPPPIFIINISDLPKRIIKEFEAVTDDKTRAYVLTQAVGRIFENLDFEHYHLSIARNLCVGFEK